MDNLQEKIDELDEEIESLEYELENKDDTIDDLNDEIDEKDNEIDDLKETVSELELQVARMIDKADSALVLIRDIADEEYNQMMELDLIGRVLAGIFALLCFTYAGVVLWVDIIKPNKKRRF